MTERYDVIVIGGGHAGCEAALAAARMGSSVLMLNHSIANCAMMPCNPSIGGPAKGILTRELDALGGEQAIAADESTLHLRWLNTSKGPALRALRAQCDLQLYSDHYLRALYETYNIRIYQSMVDEICTDEHGACGAVTMAGERFRSSCIVVACGTYLRGTAHIGLTSFPSGPIGQVPSSRLSSSLERAGVQLFRFRTDTTPRIDSSSVDWGSLTLQHSDPEPQAFSHWGIKRSYTGYACGVTRTNEKTHDILRAALDRSPIAAKRLASKGPRYCPSIDDKVLRFPDRSSHPIFLEPVGRNSREVYMQNFSTSMPPDVQVEMVRSLPGCERAIMIKPGYGIEYDRIDPSRLEPWLESIDVRGLWFAGQVCGTSGYEEAAVLGFIAGANAALRAQHRDPLVLGRSDAYIGVLVDDITTRGTDEPYRMLPSRCEHRLIMRHDNAARRLCPIGRELGLIDDERWSSFRRSEELADRERERLSHIRVQPNCAVNEALRGVGSSEIDEPVPALTLLSRPEVSWRLLAPLVGSELVGELEELGEGIEIEIKYEGYIEREERKVRRLSSMYHLAIPASIDYSSISGLSAEAREKLTAVMPRTIGAAMRIPGVNAADVQLVQIEIERARRVRM